MFPGFNKLLPCRRLQGAGRPSPDKISRFYHSVVYGPEDDGIGNDWTELFHQVQGKSGATITGLMEEPEERVEADSHGCYCDLFYQ